MLRENLVHKLNSNYRLFTNSYHLYINKQAEP